jgi:ribonuclease R
MLEGIAAHCSKTERMAEEMERAIMASLKAEFMHHRLGESFEGVISSVTPFGVFVTLKGMPIDGLVHVSNLGDDYYEFNQELLTLSGRHTGESIRLGDRIVVTVAAADIELGRVDFMRQGQSRRSKKGRSRRPLRSNKG